MGTPHHVDLGAFRAPTATGLILVDDNGSPVYCNGEALAVLSYPRRSRSWDATVLLPREIRSMLRPRVFDGRPTETTLTSGRRRYACRAFALNPTSRNQAPSMIALLLERDAGKTVNLSSAAQQFHLTQREQETIELLTLGLTSKEIATRMNISPNTVKTFFRLVMTKMGVNTRAGIVGRVARA